MLFNKPFSFLAVQDFCSEMVTGANMTTLNSTIDSTVTLFCLDGFTFQDGLSEKDYYCNSSGDFNDSDFICFGKESLRF